MNPDIRSRLEAFARDCVFHGDMTPMAERMLGRLLADCPDDEIQPLTDIPQGSPVEVVAEAMRQMWGRDSIGVGILVRARQIVDALEKAGWLRSAEPEGVHVLYRFYDVTESLLYVGITCSPPERFRDHRATKDWWGEVSTILIERCESREELQAAEERAIKAEQPRYNIKHATTPPRLTCCRGHRIGGANAGKNDTCRACSRARSRIYAKGLDKALIQSISDDCYREIMGEIEKSPPQENSKLTTVSINN